MCMYRMIGAATCGEANEGLVIGTGGTTKERRSEMTTALKAGVSHGVGSGGLGKANGSLGARGGGGQRRDMSSLNDTAEQQPGFKHTLPQVSDGWTMVDNGR